MSREDATGKEQRLAYLLSHGGSCNKEQKLLIPLASFSHGSQDSCIRHFPLALAPALDACLTAVSSAGVRRETTAQEKTEQSLGSLSCEFNTLLLHHRNSCAIPQPWRCIHPSLHNQVMSTNDFRVTFSHLKTRCVFHFIACDSYYFSAFQIWPLAALCVLYFRLQAGFLVLICTQLFLIAREEGDGNQTA